MKNKGSYQGSGSYLWQVHIFEGETPPGNVQVAEIDLLEIERSAVCRVIGPIEEVTRLLSSIEPIQDPCNILRGVIVRSDRLRVGWLNGACTGGRNRPA